MKKAPCILLEVSDDDGTPKIIAVGGKGELLDQARTSRGSLKAGNHFEVIDCPRGRAYFGTPDATATPAPKAATKKAAKKASSPSKID